MSYIASANIEVFPVAKARNGEVAPGARIFTEKNISNLSRQLLSKNNPGYIISCEKVADSSNFNIAFNLYGYYFNITGFNPSDVAVGAEEIYANIKIDDNEIYGQDDSGVYTGLDLTSTPKDDASISLKLFEKVNNEWTYSRRNFGLVSALGIGGIDGKYSK